MASLILWALFALAVVINAIFGLVRGLNKSLIRVVMVLTAVLLTFLVAGPITTLIADSVTIEGQTLGQMLLENVNADGSMDAFLGASPLVQELIMVVPALGISLVVFPVMFGFIKFTSWIAFLFVQKPLRKVVFKDERTKAEYKELPKKTRVINRFAGLGVGAVTGVIIFGMLFTPLFGVFGMLPSADAVNGLMDTMVEQADMAVSDADMIKEIYGMTDGGVVSVYGAFGAKAAGKAYINSVTAVECDGVKTTLSGELGTILDLAQTVMKSDLLTNIENPEAIGQLLGDKEAMGDMLKAAFRSEVLSATVSGALATSLGLPEEMAGAASGVFDTMRGELLKLDDAAYEKEVDAIVSLCTDFTASMESAPEEGIADLFEYAEESDVIYNTIVSVSEADPFGIEVSDAAEREAVAGTIAQIYEQTSKSDKAQGVANALASLLGVDAELNLG